MKHLLIVLLFLPGLAYAASGPRLGGEMDRIVDISPKMDRAITKALIALEQDQNADGSWSTKRGKNVGEISLAILAFMALGNLPGEGEFGHVVARGVNWILAQAQPNGLIQYTGQAKQAAVMYGHALATLMLSEVWGQSRHRKGANDIGNVLRKAVDLIVRVQGPKGGWNYRAVPKDGDTSVCVMQILALKSAQEAGIYVPEATITRALRLIHTRYDPKKKIFGYRNDHFRVRLFGSSAAGTCINYVCGVTDERYTKDALERLFTGMTNGDFDETRFKMYFLYYASVSAYAAGEETFAKWVELAEPHILKQQRGDGTWGEVYKTSFAVLAAALPYRYLPIYQR